jgi:hypothetical protein
MWLIRKCGVKASKGLGIFTVTNGRIGYRGWNVTVMAINTVLRFIVSSFGGAAFVHFS